MTEHAMTEHAMIEHAMIEHAGQTHRANTRVCPYIQHSTIIMEIMEIKKIMVQTSIQIINIKNKLKIK
jgi:hypothetical protein